MHTESKNAVKNAKVGAFFVVVALSHENAG